MGVDAGPTWDWTCKFWELAYDGAMKDVKHEGAHVGVEDCGTRQGDWGHECVHVLAGLGA